MDKLTLEFLAESFERLDRMERCLTELEARPEDAELVSEVFRAVHTIKGTTAFLGYRRLERLADAGEHVLSALRSGRLRAEPEVVTVLLELMDALRAVVARIAQTGSEGDATPANDGMLIATLSHLLVLESPTEVPDFDARSKYGLQRVPNGGSDQTVRVNVEVLNRLVSLVGELALTRDQMFEMVGACTRGSLNECVASVERLDVLTNELSEAVLEARMQPVASVFAQMSRMVRDLALHCGKSVRLELTGQAMLLDRDLLEAVRDPLLHALRNAVDHGIETPADRLRLGKAAQGRIRLSASERDGWTVIELQDDGAGINLARVRLRAPEAARLTAISDDDALQMVFLPGLTTATKVTRISGRGVGMDVVKSNVERVGGRVELESCEGVGTLLRLMLPQTLMKNSASLMTSAGEIAMVERPALIKRDLAVRHTLQEVA